MDENIKTDSIYRQLCKIINDDFGVSVEAIKPESSLIDDMGLEELDLIMFIMTLENEWNLTISEEDADKIHTVKDAYDYIKGKIGG